MLCNIFRDSIATAIQRNIKCIDIFFHGTVTLLDILQLSQTDTFPVSGLEICLHIDTQNAPSNGIKLITASTEPVNSVTFEQAINKASPKISISELYQVKIIINRLNKLPHRIAVHLTVELLRSGHFNFIRNHLNNWWRWWRCILDGSKLVSKTGDLLHKLVVRRRLRLGSPLLRCLRRLTTRSSLSIRLSLTVSHDKKIKRYRKFLFIFLDTRWLYWLLLSLLWGSLVMFST